MRILHVTPFYEPAWGHGGMARASSGLCRGLARRGHEVTVATALLDPGHPREETVEGVRVRRFEGPGILRRHLVPWARGLAAFLERELPGTDLVHVHGHRNGLAWTAARAAGRAGVPYVLQPHGTLPLHGQRALAKRAFDLWGGRRVTADAAALIAVSDAEARDLPRPAARVRNGVEGPEGPGERAEPGGRLLFVGSDRPQKRLSLVPPLLAELPDASLVVVGPLGERSRGPFARFAPRVEFRGVLDPPGLAAAYRAADLLVHPAVGEAFGLVPFEAALCGTPAVVAAGHGCGEWFARAGGCAVPPDDAAGLAAAVGLRLRDARLGEAEARAVAAFARRELTWALAAAEAESVYREVLARTAVRSRRSGDP